jgi:hypothetical protein
LPGNNVARLLVGCWWLAIGACAGRHARPAAGAPVATAAEAVRPSFFAAALRRQGGAHVHATLRLSVGRGGGAEPTTVTTTTDVWVDRIGNTRIHEENDRDGGRDVVLTGRELYVALRYGKMIHRAAEEPEPTRLMEQALGGGAAAFDLAAPAARFGAPIPEMVNAVPVTAYEMTLGDPSAPAGGGATSYAPLAAWRAGARIDALAGRIVVDDRSGAVVAADISVGFHGKAGGTPLDGTVESHTLVTDVAAVAPIAAPPAEELTLRQRTVPEARDLLRGLATAGGANPTRPATVVTHGSRRRRSP